MDQVLLMSVEPSGAKNEVGLEHCNSSEHFRPKMCAPRARRGFPWLDGNVEDAAWVLSLRLCGVLTRRSGAREENLSLATVIVSRRQVAVAFTGLLVCVVEEVHGGEQHVLAVLEVQPGLVLVC